MSGPELKFYTNIVAPSLTENGSDVINAAELDARGYLTANQLITLSGDATGSGTTSISVTLANSGVTTGTYHSITVDSKGRVTNGSNPTTLSGYGITDAQSLNSNLTSLSSLSNNTTGLVKFTNGTASFDSNTYLTSNQNISISGDATGSGTTSISLTLTNSGVTTGTYNNSSTAITPYTVNAKGLITATGSPVTITPSFSSITNKPTTISGYGITDAQPLNSNLTSLSSLSNNTTGLVKFTNGTASFDSNTYLTSNQNISISGDATGSGTTSISLTLANSGVTAGTYQSVTVDSKGRVTSGSTGSSVYNVVTTAANYSATVNDGIILVNGKVTITLPAASSVTGKSVIIKRISNTGPVTVDVTNNSTIDGYTNVTIDQQYTSLTVVSNGTAWWII